MQSSGRDQRRSWLDETRRAPLPLVEVAFIMPPSQKQANEPEKVFGGQTEVAWLRRERRDSITIATSKQGDDSMKRVLLCLVAGAGLLLPAAAQAKSCCCKPVKVKCCKPVKVKCCQPICCQTPAPCGTAGAATVAPAPGQAPAPPPPPAEVKKPYEEKAAPPPPAEKKADEKKKDDKKADEKKK
jgi:hypothetical protein